MSEVEIYRPSLADTANREHRAAMDTAGEAIVHAIRCGEALITARTQMPAEEWTVWVEDNLEFTYGTSASYIRLATYKELFKDLESPPTIRWALERLKQLAVPSVGEKGKPKIEIPAVVIAKARDLRKQGMGYPAIGRELGLSPTVIQLRIDPTFQKRKSAAFKKWRNKQVADRKSAQRAERDKAVKKVGGSAAEAYSLLRKCAIELDKALGDADTDERLSLRSALAFTHKAEDQVVEALRASRKIEATVPNVTRPGRPAGYRP